METDNIESVTDPLDLVRIANLTDSPDVLEHSIVKVGYLPDFVDGMYLNFSLPGEDYVYSFLAKNVIYKEAEDAYHWYGRNLDTENVVSITRSLGRTSASLIDKVNDYYYEIVDLAEDKGLLIKYALDYLSEDICDTPVNLPDDDNYPEPEETYDWSTNDSENIVGNRDDCGTKTIRVLFLSTVGAGLIGNPATVAARVIMQANSTAQMSGTDTAIVFELAGVELLPGFLENPNDPQGDLRDLSDNQDAQDLRDAHFADIVMLLTDNVYPGIAGRALGIKVRESRAYCIAEIDDASNANGTGVHEISHLIGARHQRCVNCINGCDPSFTYAHGNVLEDIGLKTAMGVLTCDGIRVLQWSNPDVDIAPGFPSGESGRDNARRIDNHGPKVACFRDSPPVPGLENSLSVGISGPVFIDDLDNTYTYFSSVSSNAVPPLTFLWEVSDNGFEFEIVSSEEDYFVDNINEIPEGPFSLRLTVFDSSNQTGSATFNAVRNPNFTDSPISSSIDQDEMLDFVAKNKSVSDRFEMFSTEKSQLSSLQEFSVFPNPVTDKLNIVSDEAIQLVIIRDYQGKMIVRQEVENQTKFEIDSRQLPSGVYYIFLLSVNSSFTKKIIKL